MMPSRMDRRAALRRLALLAGGAVSAPTLAAALSGCQSNAPGGWSPAALTEAQSRWVATVAERIIPATDTPGAEGARVHRFIDTLLAESFLSERRKQFFEGLDAMEARCEQQQGQGFLDCGQEEQMTFLTALDEEAFGGEAESEDGNPPFFRVLKELTLIGYYTSEIGASRELKINIVPGHYDPCVPYSEIGRAWSAEV